MHQASSEMLRTCFLYSFDFGLNIYAECSLIISIANLAIIENNVPSNELPGSVHVILIYGGGYLHTWVSLILII